MGAEPTMVDLVDFGFGTVTVNGTPALGARPLVTVLMEFDHPRFEPEHTPAFYRELLFGSPTKRPTPCIAGPGGLYEQNSGGGFFFTDAGVLGPFVSTVSAEAVATEAGVSQALAEAITHVSHELPHFDQLDRNGDGTITRDELHIVVIFAGRTEDSLTTSDPRWVGAEGDRRSLDYVHVRLEGYVDDPARPAPSGAAALHRWFSLRRDDHYLTSDPAWNGAEGDSRAVPDYSWVRREGFVSRSPSAVGAPGGKLALHTWWSPSRADNLTTSDPTWAGAPGSTRPPDYRWVRLEGYVDDPALPQPAGTVPLHRWYSTRTDAKGGNRGPSPATVAAGGKTVSPGIKGMVAVLETLPSSTIAHELGHNLGYHIEHYGTNLVDWNYSLMSGTTSGLDSRESISHDAFFKMKLGWLSPKILTTSSHWSGGLWSASLPRDARRSQALLVYNPQRGLHEFFLLEYRNGVAGEEAGSKPLYSWWNADRDDNFATSDAGWAGRRNDIRADGYRFTRNLGYVLTEPAAGTMPLYSWWNESRGDNLTTTDPNWAADKVHTGYSYVGVAGHVYGQDQFGRTMPLYSWWSNSRADNFLTSDPDWVGKPGDTKSPDYTFVRTEGHIGVGVDLNYDGDPWRRGSAAMPDSGLAIWLVQTDSATDLKLVPAINGPIGQSDRAIYLVPPEGTPGFPKPGRGLSQPQDPTARPKWLDGTPSGLSVRVGSAPGPMIWVELGG
jgi:hypothetical protein